MMNGNYGGWMMIIGMLICIAIIVAIVWLVMRLLKNKQAAPLAPTQQQQPYHTYEQGYQPPPQAIETYQEGGKQYDYPQQQEQPLN